MGTRISSIAWGLVVISGIGLTAQTTGVRRVDPPRPGVTFTEAWRPTYAPTGETKIIGTVIDIRQVPVAYAQVQLRNLLTGEIPQKTQADGDGHYEFVVDQPSTYVVEMLVVDGYVIALSNAGSLAKYETMQTVIQLPGRWDAAMRNMVMVQNPVMFLGMSAQTTMTAATLTIAVDQNIPPVDAGEPVSAVKP